MLARSPILNNLDTLAIRLQSVKRVAAAFPFPSAVSIWESRISLMMRTNYFHPQEQKAYSSVISADQTIKVKRAFAGATSM